MFDSIKSWLDVPLYVRKFDKRDGAGDKSFKNTIVVDTYPVIETKYVRTPQGAEVLSSSHYYMEGSTDISVMDEVQLDDGDWLQILSIEVFYRNGRPDLKVVYT